MYNCKVILNEHDANFNAHQLSGYLIDSLALHSIENDVSISVSPISKTRYGFGSVVIEQYIDIVHAANWKDSITLFVLSTKQLIRPEVFDFAEFEDAVYKLCKHNDKVAVAIILDADEQLATYHIPIIQSKMNFECLRIPIIWLSSHEITDVQKNVRIDEVITLFGFVKSLVRKLLVTSIYDLYRITKRFDFVTVDKTLAIYSLADGYGEKLADAVKNQYRSVGDIFVKKQLKENWNKNISGIGNGKKRALERLLLGDKK